MPKHLLIDDHIVEESIGLTRTMHKPGNRRLVLKADRPSDGTDITTASAPMWIPEENRYRMIYEARGVPGRLTQQSFQFIQFRVVTVFPGETCSTFQLINGRIEGRVAMMGGALVTNRSVGIFRKLLP